MTRLYIDEHEVSTLPPELTSVEEVLKLVEASHLAPNMVIRQVQIDGLPLISDQGGPCIPERIDDRERIHIFTGSFTDVACDSIREATTYLDRVEGATPSLAASFRSAPGPEAFAGLQQFYEGFYWLNLLLDRLQIAFGVPLESLAVEDRSGRELHQSLISALKAVIEAHESKDFARVGDLLEFEVLPLIPASRTLFTVVRNRVGASG